MHKICLRHILLITAIFILTATVVAEDAIENEWSPEVARKLLELDLQGDANSSPNPIILYSLYFVNLENSMENNYALTAYLKENIGDEEWQLISDTTRLWIGTGDSFSDDKNTLNILNRENIEENRLHYNTRLLTTAFQPVILTLNENVLSECPEEGYCLDNTFYKLSLLPSNIDVKQYKVLTNLLLTIENTNEIFSNLDINLWVDEEADQPAAFLVRKVKNKNSFEADVFAIYLTANIISGEELVKSGPLITAGVLNGFNNLFSSEYNVVGSHNQLGLYGGNSEYQANFKGNYNYTNYYFDILNREANYLYNAGIDISISGGKGLSLSGMYDSYYPVDDLVRLGISDELDWGSSLQVCLGYFPYSYNLDQGFDNTSLAKLSLIYNRPRWDIWYKGVYVDGELYNNLGFVYDLNSSLGISLKGSKSIDEEKMYLGLIWYLGGN